MGDMTQEREAMERLEESAEALLSTRDDWEDYWFYHAFREDVKPLAQWFLSRHARSRQPITVEGLVACDMDRWMEGGIVCFEKGPVRVLWGLLPHVFLRGEMCHPQPTNMAQIDDLLSR